MDGWINVCMGEWITVCSFVVINDLHVFGVVVVAAAIVMILLLYIYCSACYRNVFLDNCLT